MTDTPRPRRWLRPCVLALLVLGLQAGSLPGPLRDGQGGNCAAMFAIMARNARALGLLETAGVPLVNPVPPGPGERRVPYTHHPPGLPWAVMAADRLPLPGPVSGRLVALALSLCSVLMLARLGDRLGGPATGWAAGLLLAALPAGRVHGLLVNYETIALPALIGLTSALVLERGRAWLWAGVAALADWPALLPLALAAPWVRRRRLVVAGAAAALVVLAVFAHGRLSAEHTTDETLGQALLATFLNPAFTWRPWLDAGLRDGVALFGPLAVLVLTAFWLPDPPGVPRRRLLAVLLASGLANVTLFAWHAVTHQHFWLLLAPFVALAGACLAFPSDGARPTLRGVVVIAALLASGGVWGGRPVERISQAERAATFAALSSPDAVYVTPAGVPLVFLEAAGRHVWPFPVDDLEQARAAGRAHVERFGGNGRRLVLAVPPGEALPRWSAAIPPALERDGWRLVPLDG